MSEAAPNPPALRVDAERNRLALIDAATTVFARRGMEAPLDEVAREAGVGIATLYRRFPERTQLVEAVFEQRMRLYADHAVAAAARALLEPWDAFRDYVTFIFEQQATDTAFADVLIAPLTGSPVFADMHRAAFQATITLVARAHEAGAIRADFSHADLYLATLANAGLVKAARSSGPEASRRLCAYLLESFRPGSRDPLPPVPRVWERTTRT
jgi:AcrR family transcriptional regulator